MSCLDPREDVHLVKSDDSAGRISDDDAIHHSGAAATPNAVAPHHVTAADVLPSRAGRTLRGSGFRVHASRVLGHSDTRR
jgi:hypothetical protein